MKNYNDKIMTNEKGITNMTNYNYQDNLTNITMYGGRQGDLDGGTWHGGRQGDLDGGTWHGST